jgi:large subunit ribosomal protein L25
MTSEKHELVCQPRKVLGRKLKKIRAQGIVPANVFGNKITSKNIQANTKEFQKFFSKVGESTLSYLKVEGEKELRPVFVSLVSKHVVTGDLLHVAFHQVDLTQKVSAPVPIVLVGESQAEKDKLGIMVQQLDEIEVEALPTDMPEKIEIAVSSLTEVGAHILVKDIAIDQSKLHIKTDPESIVVQIEALAKEEVVVAPVVEAAAPVEGAAPTEGTPETPAKEEAKTPAKPEAKK